MSSHWLMIEQLDKQLKEWQAVSRKYGRPRGGWVKTLREALSMSVEQLANRLRLSRSRIAQLENAEIHDAVTLRTLREVANALECEFVYAIVPKNHSSLESIIKTRAEQVAIERIARVAHSMSLEAQSVDNNILKKQKELLTKSLTEHFNKKFWADLEVNQNEEFSNKLAETLHNTQMQKNKKIQNNLENVNALKESLIRAQKGIKNNSNNEQNALLKKLIKILQQKKK